MLTEHISTCKQSKYIFKKKHLLSHPLIHQMLHIEKKNPTRNIQELLMTNLDGSL